MTSSICCFLPYCFYNISHLFSEQYFVCYLFLPPNIFVFRPNHVSKILRFISSNSSCLRYIHYNALNKILWNISIIRISLFVSNRFHILLNIIFPSEILHVMSSAQLPFHVVQQTWIFYPSRNRRWQNYKCYK